MSCPWKLTRFLHFEIRLSWHNIIKTRDMKLEKQTEQIDVIAYAGYKGNERPTCIVLKGGKRILVQHVIDRWYGPENDYFKFLGDDGKRYLIRLYRESFSWYLEKVLS